jgi:hypothetical protein
MGLTREAKVYLLAPISNVIARADPIADDSREARYVG